MTYSEDGVAISTNQEHLDLHTIHNFLKTSYWSENTTFEAVKKSVENSLCFGVYKYEKQIGFARAVTDYVKFAWLADVFILQEYRGRGLSKWLMEYILDYPKLQDAGRWLLATRDAHGLYKQFGFRALEMPESFMERKMPRGNSASDT